VVDATWTPRRQGDLGELSAMHWLVSVGAAVYVPLLHSPDCDLVADLDGCLLRVQVKTSTYSRGNRFEVMLATRGGNQSWNGLVKRLDPTRCGPKYAEYEVDRGEPLAARERVVSTIGLGPER
jgi:hypothetical protein